MFCFKFVIFISLLLFPALPQGSELPERTLESGIFVEFDERKAHRVYESPQSRHKKVDAVAEQ